MTVTIHHREEFEATIIPGESNQIYLAVDWLKADNTVGDPFDGSEYQRFYCQACAMPTAENRNPDPLLAFNVVHLPGFIPDGDTVVHPGAFLLLCDVTESRKFQDQWVMTGLIDLFGIKANGESKYIARGHFNTLVTATRVFE